MKGRLINEGRTAEIFEYGEGRVLKLFRKGFSAEAANEEYEISEKVARAFKGAPAIYEKVECEGRPGFVMERIEGDSLLGLVMRQPWKISHLARRLARAHARILSTGVSGLLSQKVKLRYQIMRSDELSEEEKGRICSHLESLSDGETLCHGDFHPDNLITDKNGDRVIDWMTAGAGCAACDIARSALLLDSNSMPHNAGLRVRLMTALAKKAFFRAYRKEVLRLSGLDWTQIEPWILPHAAARLVEGNPQEEQKELLRIVRTRLALMGD